MRGKKKAMKKNGMKKKVGGKKSVGMGNMAAAKRKKKKM